MSGMQREVIGETEMASIPEERNVKTTGKPPQNQKKRTKDKREDKFHKRVVNNTTSSLSGGTPTTQQATTVVMGKLFNNEKNIPKTIIES